MSEFVDHLLKLLPRVLPNESVTQFLVNDVMYQLPRCRRGNEHFNSMLVLHPLFVKECSIVNLVASSPTRLSRDFLMVSANTSTICNKGTCTIAVRCFPSPGVLSSEVLKAAMPKLKEFEKNLPPGYKIRMCGDYYQQHRGFGE